MAQAYGEDEGGDRSLRPTRGPRPATTVTAATAAIGAARRDPARVLLEGVHALKHALRFGADIEVVATPDRGRLTALLADLAPDVELPASTVELPAEAWRALVPRELPSPALAVAIRPIVTVAEVAAAAGRVVVLERPRHLGNLGAVIRVAAAADAGGVLVVGDADPWHPTAVRAAAGLQFALPTATGPQLPPVAPGRPVVALHPAGDPATEPLPEDAMLLVGTERGGLTPDLLARADTCMRLPMRAGVSSLNLATAVAAALYTGLPHPGRRR